MKSSISYSPEVAARIAERLADGRSLRAICEDADMPSVRSVLTWLAEKAEFRQLYGAARALQADLFADQILAIADGLGEGPGESVLSRAKLRVDTRKWLMARLAPRKYGDRLLSGEADGDQALVVQVVRYDDRDLAQ